MQDGIFHKLEKNIYAKQTKTAPFFLTAFKNLRNSAVFFFSVIFPSKTGSRKALSKRRKNEKNHLFLINLRFLLARGEIIRYNRKVQNKRSRGKKTEKMAFNRKIFAMLLESAKGDRSWRQFAADCDISYIQMRKLALQQQVHSPRPKLIRKIALNASGGVTAEDLFFCGGAAPAPEEKKAGAVQRQGELFEEKFQALSSGQKKMVLDFIDFLSNR